MSHLRRLLGRWMRYHVLNRRHWLPTGWSMLPPDDNGHSFLNSESEEAIRSIKIRDMPIQEDETEAQQAMSSMANQLRAVGR